MKYRKITAWLLVTMMMASVATGCKSTAKIDKEAVVATLDKEKIQLGLANFYARYQQAGMDEMYVSYLGEDAWKQDMSGKGITMEQETKDSVMENLETMYLLEDHMADYKIELTKDEKAAMKKAAETFMDDNNKQAIDQLGATQEYVEELLRLMTIQNKMHAAIIAEVDPNVSDEEAKQRTFSYVTVNKTTHEDKDGKQVEYTEDEKKDLKKTVEKVAKDAANDFDKAVSDAGYTATTYSYDANPAKDDKTDDTNSSMMGGMDKAVTDAADQLKEGEVSKVVETDSAYYILRLDSEFDKDATENKKQSILTQRQNEHYTEICDGYKKDVKWKVDGEVWDTVKFDTGFTVKREQAETNSSTDVSE